MDATMFPLLRLLNGVEVDEGLRNYSQDNLTHGCLPRRCYGCRSAESHH